MQTPPPFNPQVERPYGTPPRKNNATNIVLIVLAVFAGFCCLLFVGGGLMAGRMMGPLMSTAECTMTMGFTEAAIDAYEKKNGHYPNAATWQDDIQPFYAEIKQKFDKKLEQKNDSRLKQFFKMPNPGEPLTCKTGSVTTGFAFNDEVSGKKKDDIKDKHTVVLYEVLKPEKNAHGKYDSSEGFSGPELFGTKRDRFTTTVKSSGAEFDMED